MLSKGQDINGPKTQILTANFVWNEYSKEYQKSIPFQLWRMAN